MMNRALLGAAACAALLVAGCATYSEDELASQCPLTDWYEYGVNDGRLGQPPGRAAEFFEGCRGLGIEPDPVAYTTGREIGLRDYCTAANGYEVGVEGRRYHDVCPADLEPAFQQGLARGRADRPVHYADAWPYFSVGIGIGGYHRHRGLRSGVAIGF